MKKTSLFLFCWQIYSVPCLFCCLVLQLFLPCSAIFLKIKRTIWVSIACIQRKFTGTPLFSRASLVAQKVKRLPAMREARFDPWVGKIPWRRQWQSTPALLPGKSHGQRSLTGYSPWGRKELDMTEQLPFRFLPILVDSLP